MIQNYIGFSLYIKEYILLFKFSFLKMKKIFYIFLIVIYLSYAKSEFKKTRIKHGQDCISDKDCGKGLSCILYRCMTEFEQKNIELLGLKDNNICDNENFCPLNQECIEHRCIDASISNKNKFDFNIDNINNEIDANLLFTGSILLDKRAFKSGEIGIDQYNYNHLFTNITKKIKSTDLSITNIDTVFYIKEDISDKNFPLKINNTPKELGDSLAYAGFRCILHGSPFAYFLKNKGIINTLNFWEANYPFIKILGISRNEQEAENNFYIYNIGKIKIGIINFSAFKDNKIPEEDKFMVNIISKEKLMKIKEHLKDKTDFNIVCINWGKRNKMLPDKKQINIAKKLADSGFDLIIGNYPYNVQPVSYVQSEKGNKILVFWSLGLFVGDVDKNKNYTLGAMADIKLKKIKNKTIIWKYKMLPVVNHITGDKKYSIYKLEDYRHIFKNDIISREKCENIYGFFSKC